MNWIDKSIAYLNPIGGVRRAQARMALDAVRIYEAAKSLRSTDGWVTSSGSATAEIAPSLMKIRNRCRALVRDNEYASRGLDALVANTVGTGIVANAPDQKLWDDWCDYCDYEGQLDFNGLTELAHRTRREAGEVLIRFRPQSPDAGMTVPLQLQVLEPDHLDTFRFGPIGDNGDFIITGVQFNSTGRRTGYWLYPIHPGEIASYRLQSFQSSFVPASEVLHYYRKRRPTQVRGMPEMATALLRLRDLADYEQAELVRKKIEACFVAFVKTDDEFQQLGDTKDMVKGPPRQEKVSPGMIKYLKNMDSVTFGAPAQSGGYGDYTGPQLHAVAAGSGCTYEQMTGDYSQTNYSSYRGSQLEFRKLVEPEQWLALVPMMLNPIAQRFQVTARLAGATTAAPKRFEWSMPKMEWPDPLKDVLGEKEEIRGGMKSLSESIRRRGYNPDKVFAEVASDLAKLKSLGVLVDTDASVASRLIDAATAAAITK